MVLHNRHRLGGADPTPLKRIRRSRHVQQGNNLYTIEGSRKRLRMTIIIISLGGGSLASVVSIPVRRRRSAFHPPTPPPTKHTPTTAPSSLLLLPPSTPLHCAANTPPLLLPAHRRFLPILSLRSSVLSSSSSLIPSHPSTTSPNSCPRPHLRACQPSLASPATVTAPIVARAVSPTCSSKLAPGAFCRSRINPSVEIPPLSRPSSTMTTAVANPSSTQQSSLAPARHPSPRHFSALATSISSVSPPASAAPEPASKRQRSNASPPSYGARSNSNERSTGGKASPISYVSERLADLKN